MNGHTASVLTNRVPHDQPYPCAAAPAEDAARGPDPPRPQLTLRSVKLAVKQRARADGCLAPALRQNAQFRDTPSRIMHAARSALLDRLD